MRFIAALIACTVLAASTRAATVAEQIASLDDPEVFEAIVKSSDAALSELMAAINGPRPDLAVRALGRIKNKQAVPALLPLAKTKDDELRASAAWAIGQCGGDEASAALVSLVADPYAPVRSAAVSTLAQLKSAEGDRLLKKASADPAESVRLAAVQTIRQSGRAELFPILVPMLQYRIEMVPEKNAASDAPKKLIEKTVWTEPSAQVRLAAVATLGEVKAADAIPALIEALEREDSFNRQAIIRAIEGMGPAAAGVCLGRIVPMPYDKEAFEKRMPTLLNNGALAVIAGRLGDPRCVPALLNTLTLPRAGLGRDKDLTELYIQSVELLGKYKCERAGRPIAELLKDAKVRQLSEACEAAVKQIGRAAARPLARNMDDWSLAPTFLRLLREPELRTHVARDGIIKFLQHESDDVRLAATETLGIYLYEGILDEYDLPMLEVMYLDPNREVRASCRRWKDKITAKAESGTSTLDAGKEDAHAPNAK